MLLLIFLRVCFSLQHCTTIVIDVIDMQSMNDLFNIGCDNISLYNVTSIGSKEIYDNQIPFFEVNNLPNDAKLSVSIIDCDLSSSVCITHPGNSDNRKIDLTITSSITNGFRNTPSEVKATFNDCTINITAVSEMMNKLNTIDVQFINCIFIGKIASENRNF